MSRQTMAGLEDMLSEEKPAAKRRFSGRLMIFGSPWGPVGCHMSIDSHGLAVEPRKKTMRAGCREVDILILPSQKFLRDRCLK